MESKQKKQLLREEMSLKLSKFHRDRKDEIDQKTCADIYQIIKITNAKTVHTYLPMKEEIDISPLIKKLLRENFTVVCPKTLEGGLLKHYQLADLDKTKQGLYNTRYPDTIEEWKNGLDLIIVPGLAFDQKGNRIGYGGGYYDRFLKGYDDSFSLGVCYPFQLINEVPTEDYDVQVDDVYFSAL